MSANLLAKMTGGGLCDDLLANVVRAPGYRLYDHCCALDERWNVHSSLGGETNGDTRGMGVGRGLDAPGRSFWRAVTLGKVECAIGKR
jgi:hypothetical protein